jgi:hypothetical protein
MATAHTKNVNREKTLPSRSNNMDQDTLFKSVDLDVTDQEKLRGLRDKEVALQNLVAMQQERAEARAEELVVFGRETWAAIAAKYKLDVQHINYQPNEGMTQLVPTVVKLR